MRQLSWLWELAAWFSLPLLAILAGVMARTRRHREFPYFFAYVLMATLVGVLRFVIYKNCSQKIYFYAYWSSDFIMALVSLLAIYETFVQRTFAQFAKVRFYKYLFPVAAAVITFLGFLTALNSPNRAAAFFIISRAFDFLRTALIGFFVLLVLVMGRELKTHEFSIALGFGIQAAVTLVNAALTTRAAYKTNVLARVEPLAFDAACLIWLWSFLYYRGPTSAQVPDKVQPELLQQARTWEAVLKNWLRPKKRVL